MRIIISASKSELVAAAEIKKFFDRATIGWIKPETDREAERVAKIDSIKVSAEIPEQYIDDVVKLLNTYSIELVSLVRGAISLANGLKGLITSGIKKDFHDVVANNKAVIKSEVSADTVADSIRRYAA